MATTLADIVSEIENTIKTSATNPQINEAVIEAAQAICDEENWWFLATDKSFSTVNGTEAYSITSTIGITDLKDIKEVRYENGSDKTEWELARLSPEEFRTAFGLNQDKDTPDSYMEWDDKLYLGPSPDAAYTIRVYYYKEHPTSGTLLIPNREIVKRAALVRLYTELDMAELATPHAAVYMRLLERLRSRNVRADEMLTVKYKDF